jgi:hypothetical protein
MTQMTRFLLAHSDGSYHHIEKRGGWDYIERTASPDCALKFATYDQAVSYKNRQAHLRDLVMLVVEMRSEITVVDRGECPIVDVSSSDVENDEDAFMCDAISSNGHGLREV